MYASKMQEKLSDLGAVSEGLVVECLSFVNQHKNIDENRFKEYSAMENVQVRAEEPMNCQELYNILDACIQEVLTNENADCAEIMKKAASDFQINYLNNIE